VIEGIGIDIVEKVRFEEICSQGFVEKYFSNEEKYLPVEKLASRFAAKEAVSKSLGTGIGGKAGWLEMEVVRRESGAPTVKFHGHAADFLKSEGIAEVQVSLTHARDYAAANAVAIRQMG
jgi:holo-[acyl-carrier protein] synthase